MFDIIFAVLGAVGLLTLGILGGSVVGGDLGLLCGIAGCIGFYLGMGFGAMAGESLDEYLLKH